MPATTELPGRTGDYPLLDRRVRGASSPLPPFMHGSQDRPQPQLDAVWAPGGMRGGQTMWSWGAAGQEESSCRASRGGESSSGGVRGWKSTGTLGRVREEDAVRERHRAARPRRLDMPDRF
jgi:hypothetical protein